jgi:hypothetical protein
MTPLSRTAVVTSNKAGITISVMLNVSLLEIKVK